MLWSKKIAKVHVPNHEILGAQQLSLYEKRYVFPFAQRQKLVACVTCIWVLLEHSPTIELLPRSVLRTVFLLVLTQRNSETVTTARVSVSFS